MPTPPLLRRLIARCGPLPRFDLLLPLTLIAAALLALYAGGVIGEDLEPNSTPVELPFETDFEASEGFQLGPWTPSPPQPGSQGWSLEGELEIVDDAWPDGSQSLRLRPGTITPRLRLPLAPHTDGDIVFVDLHVKPVAAPAADLPLLFRDNTAAVAAFVRSALEPALAELHVVDGNQASGGQWIATGLTFPIGPDGKVLDWIQLSYRLDYNTGTWDLFLGGSLVFPDLGFLNGDLPTLQRFALSGDALTPVDLDKLRISTQNPLFADTTRDGLSDDWLLSHGLDPALEHRTLDPDLDGRPRRYRWRRLE